MSTTAWRFAVGTEGADDAVLRLMRLGGQELMDVRDVAVIRWRVRGGAQVQEHVTDEGSRGRPVCQRSQQGRYRQLDDRVGER